MIQALNGYSEQRFMHRSPTILSFHSSSTVFSLSVRFQTMDQQKVIETLSRMVIGQSNVLKQVYQETESV